MAAKFCALIAALSVLSIEAAILSVNDPRYGVWPKLYSTDPYVRIPVFVDTAKYATDTTCTTNINAAITQLNTDLNGCIKFVQITSNHSVGADFIWISNVLETGSPPDTCMTVPGRLVTQAGNGQKLLLVSATTTPTSASRTAADCCTKQRDVMRLLVNAIGLRNEYLRPDRATGGFALVSPSTVNTALTSFNMYNVYSTATTQTVGAYDPNSITQVPTDKYSTATGTAVFTLTGTPGTLTQLSKLDCAGIAQKYGCNAALCADPYG